LANNPEIIGLNELALKSVDYEHQLRLAALERRLGVHQGAYTLWWDLQRKMFGAEALDAAFACQEWWIKNNLYLTPDVRQAFRDAFVAVSTIVQLRGEPRDDEGLRERRASIEIVRKLGDMITKAVALPPIPLEALTKDRSPSEGAKQ
jgi:hypothetical protein